MKRIFILLLDHPLLSLLNKVGLEAGMMGKDVSFWEYLMLIQWGGSRRWTSPRPPPNHRLVLDVTKFGPHCFQPRDSFADELSKDLKSRLLGKRSRPSEDCLNLNIFTPSSSSSPTLLPVLVFIHGGTFLTGSASMPIYDPLSFMKVEQDIIFVSINYRLGVLGFLASNQLKKQSSKGSFGNYGLEDQLMALHWIKANIGSFGGDPSRITLSGHSAGSMSVNYLMHIVGIANKDNLFHQVILQSGVATTLPIRDLEQDDFTQKTFDILAKDLGCSIHENDIIPCLRSRDPHALVEAAERRNFTFVWGPVKDGQLLQTNPEQWTQSGDFARVPMIIGNMRDDGSFLAFDMKMSKMEDFDAFLNDSFAPNISHIVREMYSPEIYGQSAYWALSATATDAVFTCPARRLSMATSRLEIPVFRYRIDKEFFVANTLLRLRYKRSLGAFHGTDVAFFFQKKYLMWGKGEQGIASSLARYWSNFVRTGNPNDHDNENGNRNEHGNEHGNRNENGNDNYNEHGNRNDNGNELENDNYNDNDNYNYNDFDVDRKLLPYWPDYDGTRVGNVMIFDTQKKVLQRPHRQYCDFWDTLPPLMPPTFKPVCVTHQRYYTSY